MMTFSFSKSYRGYYLLPDYGPVISVNRPLRLSASGGDPHEGWCGEGELEAPLYPISCRSGYDPDSRTARVDLTLIHL